MKYNLYIVFAFMLALLSSCGGNLTVDNSVVNDFDTDSFLGEWYEIARFDHWFEHDMQNTKAKYTLLENGRIEVINSGVKDGKPEESKGKAKTTDTPTLLRVSFFGPFYSDYRVLLVDKDYSYALVGSGSDDYLWILSRTPVLSDDVRTTILNEAKRRGYDVGNLIWVKQD